MAASALDRRVLFAAPTGKDAAITASILRGARIESVACRNLLQMSTEVGAGVGAILLTGEALSAAGIKELVTVLQRQPSWSEPPVVVMMSGPSHAAGTAPVLAGLGNVTLLERPASVRSMLSAVQAGLRGRDRQYQLRDQIAAISAADRRKDEFLAMLAHELRNPLAPIRNAVQIIRAREPEDPWIRQTGDMIARQVGHLARLVDDLLDVSRVTQGKVMLRLETIDIVEVVQSGIELAHPFIDARRHQLTIDLPAPGCLQIEGDATRVAQVIGNLLDNAAKYTEAGGRIRVAARRDGEFAAISVRDNGIGIAADLLPRIFDLFTQAARSLDRAQGGLGVGLSLVKTLVELHGGTVEARSKGPGAGSEFVVRLPLLPDGTPDTR